MGSKWNLICSIVELIFGFLGIILSIFVFTRGNVDDIAIHIIELLLFIALLISGGIGIIRYVKQNKQK